MGDKWMPAHIRQTSKRMKMARQSQNQILLKLQFKLASQKDISFL